MTNCREFYNLDDNFFADRNCINTASEIARQPKLWNDLGKILQSKKRDISGFMQRIGDPRKIRIIMTGAGSSAFVGEALMGFIAKSTGIKCEAIHSSDIVSAPDTVLFAGIPTLLISFARSGNSPESMGAVQYARKIVNNLFEVAIVCDGSSKLYDITAESEDNLILVMPEGSNDKGFAMTSSLTCMLLAGFALLNHEKIDEITHDISLLSESVCAQSLNLSKAARELAKKAFDRVVYLGSGAFKGLAHEASLKMLELTSGGVNANYDSAAGFRHGPKSVIKDNTLSVHFISNDSFTARYDIDLLKEVFTEKINNYITAICGDNTEDIKADDVIAVTTCKYGIAADIAIGINMLVFCQMLAMFKSIELGIPTDNPSPKGLVNRVVKGVTIYPI